MTDTPLVSVVTPVYNGGKYLEACMESVLALTYPAFEHVVLDNGSTDDTNAIAARYAAADRRVRLFRNETTLPMVENWNKAISLISPDSVYCQSLHADDLLYPECTARMVDLAERHPSVGIVGSLRLRGDYVECEGLPTGREVFAGKEVARLYLRREVFGFAPTSGMIRSELVRTRRPFYPMHYLHADLAVYFELLDRTDFGFVNEVLCFSRTHADSVTTTLAKRRETLMREWPFMLDEYGQRYFEPAELAAMKEAFMRRYHRILLRSLVTRPSRSFLAYHLSALRTAGRSPSLRDFGVAAISELRSGLANPGKLCGQLRDSLFRR